MIGGRIRAGAASRGMGWTALALALLLPARAAAVCCLEPSTEVASAALAHSEAHHASGATAAGDAQLAPDLGDRDCGSLAETAPALRERGAADEALSLVPGPAAPVPFSAKPPAANPPEGSRGVEAPRVKIAPLRI